ncbi:hypothetical protein N0M98_05685 [Paenibacillus doosanensis]|uniref:Uncharacterized protein n=1 Tax=Paenibacillus konkukensis TaxID=2020716 RepID=A0ABY4RRC8_9BACL|nr:MULTISPECIES: hypothetical protein [Paenibacillus]MCS7459627.1 hypothetical protein [Paenibacillus doosanensis]UQZ84713.1 hypothetical protein SK3146_03968 [Paenibacillus konkukensis]
MNGETESKPMLVQRGKGPQPAKQGEETMQPEGVQKVNTNDALASQFPEWDLKPPAQLIRRRSTRR